MTLPKFRKPREVGQRAPGTELVLVPRLNEASPGTHVGPAPTAGTDHTPPKWAQRVDTTVGLPNAAKAKAVTRYYARVLPKTIVFLLPRVFAWLARELAYAAKGLGKCTGAWHRWVVAHGWHEAATESKGTTHAPRIHERRENSRQWRRRVTLATGFAVLGLAWWLAVVHVYYLMAGGVAVGELLAVIGRWGAEPTEAPPAKRMILTEGVPMSQVRAEILLALSLRNIEATPDTMTWDADRKQWRLGLATYEPLTADDLRAIERRIGSADGAIKKIGGETATEAVLIISYGNTLVGLPPAPDYAPLSLDVTEPHPLGKAVGEHPYALTFAGIHMCVIATTGGGKTEGHLRAMVNVTTAMWNAVNWWIDLQGGPEGPAWGRVFQERAITPEQADAVLDKAIAECYRRMQVLADIADEAHAGRINPDDMRSVWHADLGPALIVYIDEFPILAEFNGKPAGSIDLLGKVETLMRLGRKVWISVIRGMQKTGNTDSGSKIVSSQTTVWVVGPCEMSDTVNVFTPALRDAGYSPQELKAATPYGINDAGMAYVKAAGFGPDPVRSWAPLSGGEIVRRSQRRVAAGLPRLDSVDTNATIDGELVPDCLAAVEAALTAYNNPPQLATKLVIEHANKAGGHWTATTLATALEAHEVRPRTGRCAAAGGTPRCYYLEDVLAALRRLGD